MLRKLAPGVEHGLELTPRLGGWCYLEASLGLEGWRGCGIAARAQETGLDQREC